MNFKVGDRVVMSNIPSWYGGVIKLNEKCIITKMGCSSAIIWVRNADDKLAPVYKDWAAPILKNQQLLFSFMDATEGVLE